MESQSENINTCDNNPEEYSTTKTDKHTQCALSMFKHCSFESKKDKHNFFRGEYLTKTFCEDLIEYINN